MPVVTVLERSCLRQSPFLLPGPPLAVGGCKHTAPLKWNSQHSSTRATTSHFGGGDTAPCISHLCEVGQGVPLESPISQPSLANPSSEGRSSLQACSCPNTHQGLCSTCCQCHTGRGQCQGHQAGTAPRACSCLVCKRRLTASQSCHTVSRTAQPHEHSSAPGTAGRSAVRPESICPSKYALNSTKLALPFNYEVGELYWQCESCCPVLWVGCCPCYTHRGKHGWEGWLSCFPFPDFSKLTSLGIQTS